MTYKEIAARLNKNLIVCTSRKIWEKFVTKVAQVQPSDPTTVLRYVIRCSLLEVHPTTFNTNLYCLKHQQPLDVW